MPAKEKAVVHVIDDDESVRDALNGLLWSVGLETHTYGSVRQFLDTRAQAGPGCIVLDVRLPGISGLDFQSQLAGFGIHLPVVLMTGHGDVLMSVRAMKAGAVDFLPKPFRDQDMIDAVSFAIERDQQRRAADGDVARIHDCFATLSPREQQVMMGVTAGKMNKQVAGDLGLSLITVKMHRGAAMRKMCARTLPDLVRMAGALRRASQQSNSPCFAVGPRTSRDHNDIIDNDPPSTLIDRRAQLSDSDAPNTRRRPQSGPPSTRARVCQNPLP